MADPTIHYARRDDFTPQDDPRILAAEASDLELPVGMWPDIIAIPTRTGSLIHFHRFGLKVDRDGDVTFAIYETTSRSTPANPRFVLHIFND